MHNDEELTDCGDSEGWLQRGMTAVRTTQRIATSKYDEYGNRVTESKQEDPTTDQVHHEKALPVKRVDTLSCPDYAQHAQLDVL